MHNFRNFLWKTYLPPILLSIIGVFASLYIESIMNTPTLWSKIIIEGLSTICIGFLAGAVFTWVSTSSKVVEKVKEQLKEIVSSFSFIKSLNDDTKKSLAQDLITPNIDAREHLEVREFLTTIINESFEIAKNNVRMEYNVEAKVRYSQGRIRCDKTYRYKLCRGASSVYEPILIGMSDDNIKFIVKEIKITDSKGNTDTFSNISLGKRNISGEDMLIGDVKLDKYNNEPYIRVTIKTTEYGYDHWHTISTQVLAPSQGFNFKISHSKDLLIRTCDIFAEGAKFDIHKEDDELTISTPHWIKPGNGVIAILAKNNNSEN